MDDKISSCRRETIALKAITDTDNGSLYVSASLKGEKRGKIAEIPGVANGKLKNSLMN
jgi:hypothetical protein